MKVETINSPTMTVIKIDGLVHLFVEKSANIHSYIDEMAMLNPMPDCADPKSKYLTRWFIEFYLASGQTIRAEYDSEEKWKQILGVL